MRERRFVELINIKGKTVSAKWIGKFEKLQHSRRFQRIWNPRFANWIVLYYIAALPFENIQQLYVSKRSV